MNLIRKDDSGEFILLEDIKASKFNIRTYPETEIMSLAEQIRQIGIINAVEIIFRGDHYEVVDGNRRLLAIQRLGWTKLYLSGTSIHIEILSPTMDDADVRQRHSVENIGREDLREIELAQAAMEMMRKDKLTLDQVAFKWGNKYTAAKIRRWINLYEHLKKNAPEVLEHVGTTRGTSDTANKQKTAITLAEKIVHEFSQTNQKLLFQAQRERGLTADQLNIAKLLHENGMPLTDALKKAEDYEDCILKLPLHRAVRKKWEEDNGGESAKRLLLKSIKFKDPKIPPDLIFMEGLDLSPRKKKKKPKETDLL